jgi:putative inorganic carbon (hco3(-)) transporter
MRTPATVSDPTSGSAQPGGSRMWPFRTDLALLGLIAVQPLEQAVPPNAISPTKVAGAICLVTLILDLVATGRALRFDGAHAILFVLLAIGCASTLMAHSPSDAVATTIRYAGFVSLFVITTQFVDDPALIPRLVWVLSVSGAVAAVLAISNMLGGRSLFAEPAYGDSNDLAYLLATTLPVTAWLIHRAGRFRALAVACFLTMAMGLVWTLSRGAFVGLAVGIVFLAWTEPRIRKTVALAIIVVAAVAAGLATMYRATWLTAIYAKERVAAENVQSRIELWHAAAIMAAEHPLLGVGPGNFSSEAGETLDRPAGAPSFVAHNAYLEVAAEFGIGGLVAFLAFLVMQWSRLGRAVSRPDVHPLASAVRVSFVIAVVGALTLSEQFFAPIWIAASLATLLGAASGDRTALGS